MDAAHGIAGSTVVTAMARNGVEFGIRVSGTGDAWFTAPATVAEGLYFPGYGPDDANPDLGDSAITETRGIGGFAMAAAPAIVRFVGGTARTRSATPARWADHAGPRRRLRAAAARVRRHADRASTCGASSRAGRLRSSTPASPTREPGIGQIGAGIARAPLACFADALRELGRRLGVGGASMSGVSLPSPE